MKRPGILSIIAVFAVFTVITVIFSSCDSIKGDPLYAGKWQITETINSDNIVYNTVRTLELTKRSFKEIYVIRRESTGKISAIYGMSGNVKVSHSSYIFYLEELGTCVRDEMDICTEEISFFGPGTSYYDENILFYEKAVRCEMEADDTHLWLVRDINNDGDTTDPGEELQFERV